MSNLVDDSEVKKIQQGLWEKSNSLFRGREDVDLSEEATALKLFENVIFSFGRVSGGRVCDRLRRPGTCRLLVWRACACVQDLYGKLQQTLNGEHVEGEYKVCVHAHAHFLTPAECVVVGALEDRNVEVRVVRGSEHFVVGEVVSFHLGDLGVASTCPSLQ